MLGLIKADLYRVLKDKLFIVLSILCVVIAIGYTLIYFAAIYLIATESGVDVRNYCGAYGLALSMLGPGSGFGLPLGIFMIIILHKDISNGTIRNKIAMGKSRKQVYFANLIVSLICILGLVFVHLVVSFVFATIFFNPGITFDNALSLFVRTILIFVGWAALVCVVNFFTNAMKSVGPAIILYIVFTLGLTTVGSITSGVVMIFEGRNEVIYNLLNFFTNFNFVYAIASVLPGSNGIFVVLGAVMDSPLTGEFYAAYLSSLVFFSGLAIGLGLLIFEKADLK